LRHLSLVRCPQVPILKKLTQQDAFIQVKPSVRNR
jgi:hypothetical protein